eukprot:m.57826 g.57826  ORF g.57826 m.57826 type:complete len:288 (-) comp18932_c0_seq1:33-896(-)
MGADGGTIPTRDELVSVKKKPVKLDPKVHLDAQWKHCALSSQKLQDPVVADDLGRLYNKEAILNFLLTKNEFGEKQLQRVKHIKSLKDVTSLNLTANPSPKEDSANFICPVTSLEMNGLYRFVFSRRCGCALSERAVREVPSEVCHKCSKPWITEEVITINPNGPEEEQLRVKMKARKQQLKLEKKAKKNKNKATSKPGTNESSSAAKGATVLPDGDVKLANGKRKTDSSVQQKSKAPKIALDPVMRAAINSEHEASQSKAFKSIFAKSDKTKKAYSFTARTTFSNF